MRIEFRDVAATGLCVQGARRFFDAHGLDFRAFVREGIDESALNGIDDANKDRVVEAARRRLADGR